MGRSNMDNLISAKALTSEDASDAILVPFDPQLLEVFMEKKVGAFIRKRLPSTMTPNWLYVYMKAPLSMVVGRAEILSVEERSIEYTIEHCAELLMSEEEVIQYCLERDVVGWCNLGSMEVFPRAVALSDLKSAMRFFAPQSFVILSKAAVSSICDMASCHQRSS